MTRNLDIKVVSVLIAAGLWWFVATTEKTQVGLAAPVEYAGLGEDRVLVGPRPDAVDVELQAVRWIAARLSPDNIRVRLNVEDVADGESLLVLRPEQVQVPNGVRVTRMSPSRVRVTIETAGRRKVRVTPDVHGAPAAGFVVDQVTVEPSTVQIKGPRSTIETRDVVPTVPVDVSGARETVTRMVGLALPESVLPIKERMVQVTVAVRPEAEARKQQRRDGR